MKKNILLLGILLFMMASGISQTNESDKVVLITLDGLRWQELFSGADPKLMANSEYVHDTLKLKKRFWRDSPEERRKALMPFFWSEVTRIGRLHGNRELGSKVDLTNSMWFSYPGYNEILTGTADDKRINSNDKINNPNTTILEIANKDSNYAGKVAAFASWDVFPYIVNESRSGVPVNAGFETAQGPKLTEREKFLNVLQPQIPSPWGSVRLDAFTHHYAMEYMKKSHPKFVYIAYGETDDFAHDGNYEAYLNSANNTDKFIEKLWNFVQADPFYKDRTTFIITTDHGRGTEPLETWRHHGAKIKDAGEVWIIAFGKQIQPVGESQKEEQLYSDQIAPTVLKLLGLSPENSDKSAKLLPIFRS
ncbi:sulfatase-like hydrolase/transferase [Flavobacteriaceae bacterium R33]|uniref:Sulfatase-like hydrolase/transferase n=2 Tax=Poritiphilus flavus TaxID=2697053 RepID=A0A6L9E783_9FLAO|nr:sulfatase-like hydrolase/transferase [Poritiphilus flavus]